MNGGTTHWIISMTTLTLVGVATLGMVITTAPSASPTSEFAACMRARISTALGARSNYVDSTSGYTVTYPSGWIVDPAQSAGTLTTITSYDPELLDGNDASPEKPLSNFTKISIGSEDNLMRLPLKQWVRAKYTRIENVVGPTNPNVSIQTVDVGSHPAVDVQADGQVEVFVRYVSVDERVLALTVSGTAATCPQVLFDTVARSFHVH